MEDPWAMVEDAAGDPSLGASEIARKAAEALGRLPDDHVMRAIELLLRGHPSMAPLWRLATDVLSASDRASAAHRFRVVLDAERAAGDALVDEISARRLLTISYSSSVVDLVRRVRPEAVLCMRSEPGGEGIRAAEAMSPWTNPAVVEDERALSDVAADIVVVGTDAVTPSAVINKVKTRALVEAARAKEVPTYAVAGETKFIGTELPLAAVFEPTPLDLFTAVAVPEGLIDGKQARDRAVARPIGPDLGRLLEVLLNARG